MLSKDTTIKENISIQTTNLFKTEWDIFREKPKLNFCLTDFHNTAVRSWFLIWFLNTQSNNQVHLTNIRAVQNILTYVSALCFIQYVKALLRDVLHDTVVPAGSVQGLCGPPWAQGFWHTGRWDKSCLQLENSSLVPVMANKRMQSKPRPTITDSNTSMKV